MTRSSRRAGTAETSPHGRGPGRARRAIATAAAAVGLTVVFAAATGAAVVLHLGLPTTRRVASERVNAILDGTFKGKVVIHRVGLIRLTRIAGVDVEVLDPEGKRVLWLHGLRARFETLSLVRSLVRGDRILVDIPELGIDGAEVVLEEDAAGALSLQRAFEPREPATPSESGGTEVSIAELTLEHAWIHGNVAAMPVLDADFKHVAGAVTSTPTNIGIDIERLFVRGRGLPGMDPEGAVEARAFLPSDPQGETRISASYDGRIGDIRVYGGGSLTGKHVEAVVDIPETAPEAIIALAPGKIQLRAPMSLHAEVEGDLPTLRPDVWLGIGGGEITAWGTVTLPEKPRTELSASANVDARDLDVSLLQEGAPQSRLTAALHGSVIAGDGGTVSGTFELENHVGEVSGQVVPAARVVGQLTERSVSGWATISERGAPTAIEFALKTRDGGTAPTLLTFDVQTSIPDLNGISRVGPISRGSARLAAVGTLDLDTKTLAAKVTGDAHALDLSGVQLAQGFITGTVDGPVASPLVTASVRGHGLRAGGYAFTNVRLNAHGTQHELEVAAELVGDGRSPTVGARAHVSNRDYLTVRAIRVSVEREDVHSVATVESVQVENGRVDVRGLRLTGLGEPIEANARIEAAGWTVKAKGEDVDLARVAKLLAREEDARGHLAFDVDATANRRGVKGRVNASVHDLSTDGADVRVSASSDGRRTQGEVVAELREVGHIRISAVDIEPAGPPTKASSWNAVTGTAKLDGAVDLGRLLARLPEHRRPVETASGTVTLRGQVSRASHSARPAVELEASTKNLIVIAKQTKVRNANGSLSLGPEPWRIAGTDGVVGVKLSDSNGHTSVYARLHDAHGALASLTADALLPLEEIAKSPDRLMALVSTTPIFATVAVPRRSLDEMPAALGKLRLQGDVELAAELRGTTKAPTLKLTAKGTKLRPRGAAVCVRGLDVETTVTYEADAARILLGASSDGREVLNAAADVKVNAAAALEGAPLAWEASASVGLTSFPLDGVATLLGQPIAGSVSGKLAVIDLHRAASLEADLDLRKLTLNEAAFPQGNVRVTMKDGAFTAAAKLDQVDGFAEVRATGAMSWGTELAPTIDLSSPIDGAIKAKNFRANAAMPFVQGIFSELDGRIDTDARIRVEPGGKDGHMNGSIVIRDGVFEVPQIGERFHGLKGHIIMKPWGTLRFEGFSAEAPTGKITMGAVAVLDGLGLESAKANVRIAKGQSVPITLEGVPMGRAYGNIAASAQMSPDRRRLDINVDIPMLHVALPHATGNAIQSLERDKTLRIGVHAKGDFIALPIAKPEEPRGPSARTIRTAITLGEDVEIKRDTTLDVVVRGTVLIELLEKAKITGQIRLQRGKLELHGKQFVLERGVVSFLGNDPANPMVIATAYWDAPDGTRVYADFSGHVASGQLKVRSEPPLAEGQIFSLILFGSADGGAGGAGSSAQEVSAGIGAGYAAGAITDGLNKAISGITAANITTRIDTTDADSPRPELEVQLSRSVSASVGYKVGVPAPGENPDRTELTLDWRFYRNWSLSTMVGDQGSTAVDILWRIRY